MTGIPHFEDLSVQDIYDSLDLDWRVGEKIDGTGLRIGLDQMGRFYSQGKGRAPCLHSGDYPRECWASTYRAVHQVGELIIDVLVRTRQISPGQWLGVEAIHGDTPNTLGYRLEVGCSGTLMLTHANFDISGELSLLFRSFQTTVFPDVMYSPSGVDVVEGPQRQHWNAKVVGVEEASFVKARLGSHAKNLRSMLDRWFASPSLISGFTVREILDIKLSSRHEKCGDRVWADLKAEISKERLLLRESFRGMVLMFKELAIKVLVNETRSAIGSGNLKEGAVVRWPGGQFKLVEREAFGRLNRFTHRIKYMVVGGSRPARPSFLSRTAHWPREKRLARLEVLRQRFAEHHRALHATELFGRGSVTLYYQGDLVARTFNMFYDTKKRIEDGR